MGRSKHKGKHKGHEATQVKVNSGLAPSDVNDRTTPTSEPEEPLTPTPPTSHNGSLSPEELPVESSQHLHRGAVTISEAPASAKDDAFDIVSVATNAADSAIQELTAASSSPPLPDEVYEEPSSTATGEDAGFQDPVATPHDGETAAALSAEVYDEPSTSATGENVGLRDPVATPQDGETAAVLPAEIHDEPSTSAAREDVGLQDEVVTAHDGKAAAFPDEVYDEPLITAAAEDVGLQDAAATAHIGETAALPDDVHSDPLLTGDQGVGLSEAVAAYHSIDAAAALRDEHDIASTSPLPAGSVDGPTTYQSASMQQPVTSSGQNSNMQELNAAPSCPPLPDEAPDQPSTTASEGSMALSNVAAAPHGIETAAALPAEHDNASSSLLFVANNGELTADQSTAMQPLVSSFGRDSANQELDAASSSPPLPDEIYDKPSTTAIGGGAFLQEVVAAPPNFDTATALSDERDAELDPPPSMANGHVSTTGQSASVQSSPVTSTGPGAGEVNSVGLAKHDDGLTSLPPASAQIDVQSNPQLPDSMEPALPAAPADESNDVRHAAGATSAAPVTTQADVQIKPSLPDSIEPPLPPALAVESNDAIAQPPNGTSKQSLSAAAVPSRENMSGSGHTLTPPQVVRDDVDRLSQAAEIASLRQAKQELETKLLKLQKGLRNRMKELANEKQDMQLQLDSASQKAADLEAQLKEQRTVAEQQAAAQSEGATRLQMQIGRLAEELATANSELELRERALTESRRMASAKEQAALDLQHTMEQLTLQHKEAQAQLEEKNAQLTAQLAQTQADLQHNRDELVQAQAHTDTRVSQLETQLAAASADVETASAKAAEEAALLEAALEVAKADLNRRTREQEAERERVKVAMVEMRKKVERAEAARRKAVASAEGVKEVLENELQQSNTARNILEEELAAVKDQLLRLQEELRSYKQRAQMLLKRKDEELLASANAERNQAAEQALSEAQQALQEAVAERDASVRAITDLVHQHQDKLAIYEEAAIAREQRIADLQQQFDLASMEVVRVADEWRTRCETVERTWRERCEAMQAQIASLEKSSKVATRTRSELETLRKERDRLKEEFNSFRDIASSMVEAKDTEIAKLLDDMAALRVRHVRQQSDAASHISDDNQTPLSRASASWSSMTEKVNGRTERYHDPVSEDLAYQLHLQDKRDEQLAFAERKVMELQEELLEAQQEIELHTAQESALKEAIRELERSKRREGVDMTYLKNIVLNLILSGEVETLLPVVGSLLQFTPDEMKQCKVVYDTRQAVPLSAAASVVDAMAQPTHSLFSSLAATFGSRT